jgi:hypothetical protein
MPISLLDQFGERTIARVNLELPRRRRVQGSAKDRIDDATVTRHDDRLAEVCTHRRIERTMHAVVELCDRLPSREHHRVRITTPVRTTMTPNELIECEPVTLWTRVMLAEVGVNDDVGETERIFDDVGGLERPWVTTRDEHIGSNFLGRGESITKFGGLQLAEIGQPNAGSRTTKHPAHGDDGFTVSNENDPGLRHANFSTKLSS